MTAIFGTHLVQKTAGLRWMLPHLVGQPGSANSKNIMHFLGKTEDVDVQ
jgi:hypothetical protein